MPKLRALIAKPKAAPRRTFPTGSAEELQRLRILVHQPQGPGWEDEALAALRTELKGSADFWLLHSVLKEAQVGKPKRAQPKSAADASAASKVNVRAQAQNQVRLVVQPVLDGLECRAQPHEALLRRAVQLQKRLHDTWKRAPGAKVLAGQLGHAVRKGLQLSKRPARPGVQAAVVNTPRPGQTLSKQDLDALWGPTPRPTPGQIDVELQYSDSPEAANRELDHLYGDADWTTPATDFWAQKPPVDPIATILEEAFSDTDEDDPVVAAIGMAVEGAALENDPARLAQVIHEAEAQGYGRQCEAGKKALVDWMRVRPVD